MLFIDQMLVPLIVAACCLAATRRISTNSVNNRCLNGSSHEIRIVGIQNCNTAYTHPRLKTRDPSHSTMRAQGRSGNYTLPEGGLDVGEMTTLPRVSRVQASSATKLETGRQL